MLLINAIGISHGHFLGKWTSGVRLVADDYELPYLYWIPKLHKTPYKQRCIAGSKKSSTEPLSILLTKILTAVKERLQIR
jgi:hypothetical protein